MKRGEALVRVATEADAEAIAEVHVEAWRFAYTGLIPADIIEAWSVEQRKRSWRDALRAESTRGCTLVAVLEDRVVGFIACGPSRDPSAPTDRGEVLALYVDPDAVRRGVGRLLLTAGMTWLRGAGYRGATLWVLDANLRARVFYEAAGFTLDGGVRIDGTGPAAMRHLRYRMGWS